MGIESRKAELQKEFSRLSGLGPEKVYTCRVCKQVFERSEVYDPNNPVQDICYDCLTKEVVATEQRTAEEILLGASVIKVEVQEGGRYTSSKVLDAVVVAKGDKKYRFTVGGYDERHIAVEEEGKQFG